LLTENPKKAVSVKNELKTGSLPSIKGKTITLNVSVKNELKTGSLRIYTKYGVVYEVSVKNELKTGSLRMANCWKERNQCFSQE